MTPIQIRKVSAKDKEQLFNVEAKSTPGLRYLPQVFDQFLAEARGGFLTAETEGKLVACAKFSVLPDETAWLETLRVIPEYQGQGIGKKLYEQFFKIAQTETISTMRMYTGINNKVSKGLAEHFGFQLEEAFLGYSLDTLKLEKTAFSNTFKPLYDASRASSLLLAQKDSWNDFLVMNRTFYKLTPALCQHLAEKGQVYEDASSKSIVVLGARFSPEEALHIGMFAGNEDACLTFVKEKALDAKTQHIHCLFPSKMKLEPLLLKHGFTPNASPYIVMRVDL